MGSVLVYSSNCRLSVREGLEKSDFYHFLALTPPDTLQKSVFFPLKIPKHLEKLLCDMQNSCTLLQMLVIWRKMMARPCKMMAAPCVMLATTHLMFAKHQRGD